MSLLARKDLALLRLLLRVVVVVARDIERAQNSRLCRLFFLSFVLSFSLRLLPSAVRALFLYLRWMCTRARAFRYSILVKNANLLILRTRLCFNKNKQSNPARLETTSRGKEKKPRTS